MHQTHANIHLQAGKEEEQIPCLYWKENPVPDVEPLVLMMTYITLLVENTNLFPMMGSDWERGRSTLSLLLAVYFSRRGALPESPSRISITSSPVRSIFIL